MSSAQSIYEQEMAKAKAKRAAAKKAKEEGSLEKKAEKGFDKSGEMVIKGPRGGKSGVTIGESKPQKQRRSSTISSGDTRVLRGNR